MAKEDEILDMLMNMKSKDPFRIVYYSGELPEELEQFVTEPTTSAKVGNTDLLKGNWIVK